MNEPTEEFLEMLAKSASHQLLIDRIEKLEQRLIELENRLDEVERRIVNMTWKDLST